MKLKEFCAKVANVLGCEGEVVSAQFIHSAKTGEYRLNLQLIPTEEQLPKLLKLSAYIMKLEG